MNIELVMERITKMAEDGDINKHVVAELLNLFVEYGQTQFEEGLAEAGE